MKDLEVFQAVIDLGGITPGFRNFAHGINKWGRPVGVSGTQDGLVSRLPLEPRTLIRDLGTVQGGGVSVVLAINDGDIIGISFPVGGATTRLPDGWLELPLRIPSLEGWRAATAVAERWGGSVT